MGAAMMRSGKFRTTPRNAATMQRRWGMFNKRHGGRFTKSGVDMGALGKALGFAPATPSAAPTPPTAAPTVNSAANPPALPLPGAAPVPPVPEPPAPTPQKTGEVQVAHLSPTTGMRIGIEE